MSSPRGAATAARPRITYFDWLRGASTLAVVVLHLLNKVLTDHPVAELGTPLVLSWTFLQIVLTRWAVPAFLMITGALQLDPARTPSWRKSLRGMARMALALALFCPVYACVGARDVTPAAVLAGWTRALTRSSWDHLWYVYALMGLYLLTPVLATYTRFASRALQRTTLLVLAVPALLVVTVNRATGASIATVGWLTSSAFYYLLGSYAHRFLRLNGRMAAAGLTSLAAALAIATWCVCARSWYPGWLLKPECPLMAAWSLLVFLAGRRLVDGRAPHAALAALSRMSLAVYLLHPIAVVVLYRRLMWMPYETLPPVAFELAALCFVLATTVPAALLLRRMPGLGKIL